MLYIFLAIIIIELAILLYIEIKRLPDERRKAIERKLSPIKSQIFEWTPFEDEETKTSRELTENITKR